MVLSRRRFLALSKALAAGSILAGCTTDGSGHSSTPEPVGSDTPTATPTDTESPPGSSAPDGSPTTPESPTKPTGDAIQWSTRIGPPIRHGPAIHDGVVYIGGGTNDRATGDEEYLRPDTSENLTAVAADDGDHQWQHEAPAGIMTTPVANPAGVFVVIGWNAGTHGRAQRLIRLDPGGSARWTSTSVDSFLRPVALANGTVYLGTSDDAFGFEGERLWALTIDDGAERWDVDAGDIRSATVDGETLYAIEGGRRTTAFATDDGTERWYRSMAPAGRDARLFDDSLYLRSQEQNDNGNYPVVAVTAADGNDRWRFSARVDEPFVPTGAVADTDTVYITEYDGWLFAVNADDGTEQWRRSVAGETRDSPVLASDTIYLPAMDGTVHAIDATTGEERWSQTVGGFPSIVGVNAAGLFVEGGGKGSSPSLQLYGHDGTERWSFTDTEKLTDPVVVGTRAIVGTADGFLLALDES
ncbi:MAG: PQQ-binding-like beta-propeller repeat protein [Halobacteriales archaeon]